MKKLALICSVFLFVFQACFVFDFDDNGRVAPKKVQTYNYDLALLLKNADFEVSSRSLSRNKEQSVGKIICTHGRIVKQEYNLDEDRYLEIAYSSGNGPISLMLVLDHPRPKQYVMGENIQALLIGNEIRILGKVERFEELVSEYGTKKIFPIIKCIAVYKPTDERFKTPIWQCNSL